MTIKEQLKDIFIEKPYWEKSMKQINNERKQIKWIFRGLIISFILVCIFMLITG